MKIDIVTKDDLEEIKSLLHEVLPVVRQMKSDEQRKRIRGKEVQDLLGISNTKLNDLRNSGKLTFTQFGNMYYYDSESILEELNRNRVKCRDCA